jgi:hypothetical protein
MMDYYCVTRCVMCTCCQCVSLDRKHRTLMNYYGHLWTKLYKARHLSSESPMNCNRYHRANFYKALNWQASPRQSLLIAYMSSTPNALFVPFTVYFLCCWTITPWSITFFGDNAYRWNSFFMQIWS